MKTKKIISSLLLSAVLVMGLSGCGNNTASSDEKVLRVAVQDAQAAIDMQKCTYSHVAKVADQIVESLLTVQSDGSLKAILLKDIPVLSEDGLTYSFELKENVKFHNGEVVKSSDVKYSFERLLKDGVMSNLIDMIVGANEVIEGQADSLEGFKIVDDTKFEITLNEEYIPFLSAISTAYVGIYPQAACEEAGDDWGLKVLYGTGPFKFVDYTQGTGINLVKNEEYHGNEVKIDKIEYKFIADSNTQVMEFKKGNVDVVQLDSALYPTYSNDKDLKDKMRSFTPVGLVYLNVNNEEITDSRIKEALSYAIDREAICNDLLYGTATPAKTFIPEGLLGYNSDAKDYEYNPTKAKELLAEAGYPNGIDLEATSNTKYPTLVKVITAIQDQAKEAGINIIINQVDSAAYADINKQGKIILSTGNWYVDYIDPDGMIYQRMSRKITQNGSNKYDNAEFNDLIDEARATEDEAKREELYIKADEILTRKDFGAIPIYNEKMFYLTQDYITGFEVSSTYRYYFGDVDIQK